MTKPDGKLLVMSIVVTVLLYLLDIYILDPIAPDPSWRYRITNFAICLVIYTTGIFMLSSLIYICVQGFKKSVNKR